LYGLVSEGNSVRAIKRKGSDLKNVLKLLVIILILLPIYLRKLIGLKEIFWTGISGRCF